jgi:L-ascorbate metabolism protein UlaG (beta-lactamase superfamily)
MISISFYGHGCFGANVNGCHLLFDPFISPNEKANHIDIDQIPADFILISHGHEDHVADVEKIAKRSGAKLISNFEIISWFASEFGIDNGHPMNHGGSWDFEFGKVKYVNAVHSSTLPDGKSGGNPGGFVIESKDGCFYYAGDTALHMDMKLIPLQFDLDFALLPIGDNFTMGVSDATIAAEFIKTEKIIGLHYDTFGFIEIDHQKAIQDFKNKNLTLFLPKIGEEITI